VQRSLAAITSVIVAGSLTLELVETGHHEAPEPHTHSEMHAGPPVGGHAHLTSYTTNTTTSTLANWANLAARSSRDGDVVLLDLTKPQAL
jgi:hypothetical protein